MRRNLLVLVLVGLLFAGPAAFGWGAAVHRCITLLALDGLPPQAPAWLRDPETRVRAAFLSNQPDRWRGWKSAQLAHANDPEHYLDADLLDEFGLTIDTLPKLRREYLSALAIAKHEHPERVSPYDATKDQARTQEWPGFVPYAVAESYARLQAAFQQVRILESLDEPARKPQLQSARELALYQIGALSHFVGDITQPLHTTKHFDGWVGDNPSQFKWRSHFRAYLDSGVVEKHRLDYAALQPRVKFETRVEAADPWNDVLAYLRRSHKQMEPLYVLERDGRLDGPEGAALIAERLCDACSILRALIWAAYASAEPTASQIEKWVRYDAFDPDEAGAVLPPATPPAAGQ